MTEEKKPEKKSKKISLVKIVIFLVIILLSYLAFNHWKLDFAKKIHAQKEIEKFDNIESEIFDLSADHESTDENLSGNNVEDLKEKGAEFIYQLLLKNQTQIADLSKQIKVMQDDIAKNKNRENIAKIVASYVDLRQKIFAKESYEKSLQSFEILAASNANLNEKSKILREALTNFATQKDLIESFTKLTPELILAKNNNLDSSFSAKIRRNLAKMIIIRRVDGKGHEVDAKIVEIEKFLQQEKYQEAMSSLLTFNQNYHDITANFLNSLNGAIEVQKADQDILNYLKSLN